MLKSSYLCTRFPRRGWRCVGFPDRGGAKNFFFFYLPYAKRDDEKKKKEKKTFEIIWKIYLKVITFASDFWKEKQFKKEAIFEEFT